jgi:hypothetical protein
MKHKTGKVIMGATLSLAAIAVAIDHTQHKLPEVEAVSTDEQQDMMEQGSPCGLGAAPCSLGDGDTSFDD